MPRLISPMLLVAALALPCSSFAQADNSCGGTPCVQKDVEVARADAGRVRVAVDAANPARLAIAATDHDVCGANIIHFTQDDGATWSHSCTMWGVWDDEGPVEAPVVAFDKQGELIAVQSFYWGSDGGTVRASRSTDGGQTWDGWSTVASSLYYRGWVRSTQLKIDGSPASPYRGRMYASFTDDAGNKARIRVASSDDSGHNWAPVNVTPLATGNEMLDFSDLAIGRDGSLYLSYLSCFGADRSRDRDCHDQPAELRFVRSTDGGQSWSKPAALAQTMLPPGRALTDFQWMHSYGALPGTKAAVSFTPVIAVDPSEGPHRNRLYMVMTTYAEKRLQVLLITSDDQGASWSAPRPMATGPLGADQFMPWISVSRQGVLAVTWMDQRKHPQLPDYQPMVAFSSDGGDTFSAPEVLQGQASPAAALRDLSSIASHTWAGQRLKTAFIGPDAAAAPTVRLSTAKP